MPCFLASETPGRYHLQGQNHIKMYDIIEFCDPIAQEYLRYPLTPKAKEALSCFFMSDEYPGAYPFFLSGQGSNYLKREGLTLFTVPKNQDTERPHTEECNATTTHTPINTGSQGVDEAESEAE